MYAHKNGVIVICDNLQLTCCYCCLPNDVVPLHFNFSSYISWRLTTFINQWCNSVTLDVDFIYYLFMNAFNIVTCSIIYRNICDIATTSCSFCCVVWKVVVILCKGYSNLTAQVSLNSKHKHGLEKHTEIIIIKLCHDQILSS